jgi:DNA-binding MarR family transcriptional regulator
MNDAEQVSDGRKMARELLRFLDKMMQAIARAELGDPGVAQLTLLEMRILTSLAEAGRPIQLGELADLGEASIGQTGHVMDRLRRRGLAERAGGDRGRDRAFVIARAGRRLLGSLETARRRAVEAYITRLSKAERLRLEGAAHLLGRDLDRLSEGMLSA